MAKRQLQRPTIVEFPGRVLSGARHDGTLPRFRAAAAACERPRVERRHLAASPSLPNAGFDAARDAFRGCGAGTCASIDSIDDIALIDRRICLGETVDE
jgi:hypothetical protein